MASTPRKFQEKIALINERAAQGTAAYEEIMQQVSCLRNKQNRSPGYCYQYPQQGAVSDLRNLTQMYSGIGNVDGDDSNLGSNRPLMSLQNAVVHPTISTHRHSHLQPPDMLLRSSSDSSLHQTAYQSKMSSSYRKGYVCDDKERPSQFVHATYELHKTSDAFQSSDTLMYNHLGRSPTIPIPTTVSNSCGGGVGGAGGGSLPDLTQVQFMPTPIPIPDLDAVIANQAAYTAGSSSTFIRANDPYLIRSPSSRGTSPGPSPRPSPNVDRKQKTKPYSQPLTIGGQRISAINKGIVMNNSLVDTVPNSSGLNIFGRPLSPVGSHPTSPIPMPLMDYRNPVASPQNSPCASPVPSLITPQTGPLAQYRCNSPDSRGSAPPSPVSLHHSSSPASSPGATLTRPFIYDVFAQTNQTTNQLNNQFQQITFQSSPLAEQLEPSLDSNGSPYYSSSASPSPGNGPSPTFPSLSQPLSSQVASKQQLPSISHHQSPTPPVFTQPIPSSPTQVSPLASSPSHSPVSPGGRTCTPLSQQPATPQTPQTPSISLPRLVITDQDGNDEQNLLNEVPEISFFDDPIFQNLSSLGEEELMSVDQILVDTEIEESFRRDLRDSGTEQNILQLGDLQDHYLQQQVQMQPIMHSSAECQGIPIQIQHSLEINMSNTLQNSPQQREICFQLQAQELQDSLQRNFVGCSEEFNPLEALAGGVDGVITETDSLLSRIHQQIIPESSLINTEISVSCELEHGICSVNNPSTVGWQQITQPDSDL